MPVRNEGPYIETSLGSVLRQSYGLDAMEVLVVDGVSEDDTRERVYRLTAEHPGAVVEILDNPGKIAPCALNVGLRHARGDVVVRVDGHCEVSPGYVSHAVAHLRNGADGVGGPLITLGEGVTAEAIAAAMSSRFGVGGSAFRTVGAGPDFAPKLDLEAVREVDTVAFPAYTRQALERNGPYDEELVRNQDDEYNYRLRKAGGRLLLAQDMPARYYSRTGFQKLWRQYAQYGFWKVRVLQKHPRQMSLRQFVPPAFVLALVAGAVGTMLDPGRLGPAFLGLVLLYAAAAAGAAWREGRRFGVRSPARLFPAFVLLHLGYGSGFLVGLVRFSRRWGDRGEPPTDS